MSGEMVRKYLRLERQERGWSQEDLAAAAGIKSRTTIRKLESGLKLSEGVEGAVEKAVGWGIGSLDVIRGGGRPILMSSVAAKPLAELTRDEAKVRADEIAEATGDEEAGDRFIDEWSAARRRARTARGTA